MVLLKIKLKSLLSQRGCQKLCDADFLIYNMKIIQKEFPLALLDCSLGVTLKLSNKLKVLWAGWKQFQHLFYFTVSTLPHPVAMSQCTPTPWSFTFFITPARWVHLSVKVNNNKAAAVYWILIFKKQIKEIMLFTYWKIQRLCINCTLYKRAINLEMHALLVSLVTDNFVRWWMTSISKHVKPLCSCNCSNNILWGQTV